MSRFALQKCSNLAQTLLANLLIARVMLSLRLFSTKIQSGKFFCSFLMVGKNIFVK